VRDPPISLTAANVGDPLTEDGGIDKRVAPEDVADAWMRLDKGAHGIVGDKGDLACDHRCEAVVHDLKVEALKVGNVAGDMEGNDLALAAREPLVAAGEALKQHAALRWPVLLAHDVLVRLEVAQRDRQRRDCRLLGVRDGGDALELSEQRVEVSVGPLDHLGAPALTREHDHSQPSGAPGSYR
jgi:hypothetical protein